jgi:hypothetical protein
MSQKKTVRVGIFRDTASARRAITEARTLGFTGLHLVTDDADVRAALSADIGGISLGPTVVASIVGLAGAGAGLLLGVGAAWALGNRTQAVNAFLPAAGLILGGLASTILSLKYESPAQYLGEHELAGDEMLVAIEASSPARIAVAERILGRERAAPVGPLQG